MKKKKVGILALTVLFLMTALCACGSSKEEEVTTSDMGSSMGTALEMELGKQYSVAQGRSETTWASFETNNKKDQTYGLQVSGITYGLTINIVDEKGNIIAEANGNWDGTNVYVEADNLERKTNYYIKFTTSNDSRSNVDCTISVDAV